MLEWQDIGMGQIYALIVVYNKCLADSATINSLEASDNVHFLVADNSTQDFGNKAFAEAHGYTYVDMGGNMGLSKAYNRVISMLDKTDDLICLFDDDTTVDKQYFGTLSAAAAAHPDIDLFAPVVMDQKGILSPCLISGVACRRIKSVSDLPHQGVSVINSGLAIRLKVFKNYRYDEGQFLDYVDHAFIRDIAGYKRDRILIMEDVTLQQRFSGSETLSRAAVERYRVFSSDFRYFCRKFGISSIRRNIVLAKRKLKLFIKYGMVYRDGI